MSTGAGCTFREVAPGQWTYWLQDWPYGEWPEGQTYGPFSGYERAIEHLSANHANPGGWSMHPLPPGQHVHDECPERGGRRYDPATGLHSKWDPDMRICGACGSEMP